LSACAAVLGNKVGLRSPQILKEFENLKFFNLGPSSDLMDENWAATLQLPKKSLLPSKMDEKKKIKGKERKDVRPFSSFFPPKQKKNKNKKTKHKGKRKNTQVSVQLINNITLYSLSSQLKW